MFEGGRFIVEGVAVRQDEDGNTRMRRDDCHRVIVTLDVVPM